MTFEPPRGRGRCDLCGWHLRRQLGHAPTCPRSRCQRCNEFGRMPASRLCAWCAAPSVEDRRRQAVAHRLAELDAER